MTWFHRRGELANGSWETVVEPDGRVWHHTGLRVANLKDEEHVSIGPDSQERIIVPLAGSFRVTGVADGREFDHVLRGRSRSTAGPTDTLYVPIGSTITVSGRGRVAVAEATATNVYPLHYLAAEDVAVELRGRGNATRQVHNFGTPGEREANQLIACEVLTPSGNWSSYPPHRHDEYRPEHESELEEIYLFDVQVSPALDDVAGLTDPIGYFRNYGTSDRPIDTLVEVRPGDVALVPHGWHGPAMATHGYDLYYLNVMAGPGPERAWNIVDDPLHAPVKQAWSDMEPDPRLPYQTKE